MRRGMSARSMLAAGRRQRQVLSGVCVGAVAALAVALPFMPARAAGVSVYLGYADTTHAGTQLPSPWSGSPGAIFEGCQPTAACLYDAGAVRVVNSTATSHTFTVVVRMDTCTEDLWPHNIQVPAGGTLILTQTVSGTDSGCTHNGHLDTSDIGPGGVSWGDHCTQSGVVPRVDLTVDGTSTTTFTDSGQVLNTGGFDRGSCPSGTSEFTPWSLVGTTVIPPTMTGRAYGAAATVTVLGVQTATLAPTPDTGFVSTQVASTTSTPCVITLTGVVTGGVLCANVTTTTPPAASAASASVASATISTGLTNVPIVSVTTVRSQSSTSCGGSSGATTILSLTIGGTTVTLPSSLPPNYTIPLLLGKLVLNEQVPVTGGLTVNAVHLMVPPVQGTGADAVLASSTSDIHNC